MPQTIDGNRCSLDLVLLQAQDLNFWELEPEERSASGLQRTKSNQRPALKWPIRGQRTSKRLQPVLLG